jgi:hypothetical protein
MQMIKTIRIHLLFSCLSVFTFTANAQNCDITVMNAFVEGCDGMNTHDTSDDVFYYFLDVSITIGMGPSGQFTITDVGGTTTPPPMGPFPYGPNVIQFPADGMSHVFEIRDVDNPECMTIWQTEPFSPCSPTCQDGTQNGDETGVDCGGQYCAPCQTPCDLGLMTNPQEVCYGGDTHDTSDDVYEIIMHVENMAAPGSTGTYDVVDAALGFLGTYAYGATVIITLPADGNSHVLTLQDSNNPNCMMTYTTGTLVPCSPTCQDGAQNGDETGVDCGGQYCAPCDCTVPTNLGFTVLSNAAVQLSWDPAPGATGYKIRYRIKNIGAPWTYKQVTSNTPNLTGLTNGVLYEARIQAKCGTELSASSDYLRWKQTLCQSPVYSSIVAQIDPCSPRNVLVSWTPPANVDVIRYKVLYRPSGTSAWNAKYTPADGGATTEKLLSQLELNTQYDVRVKTWCAGGEKSFIYNGWANFTTVDNSGCSNRLSSTDIKLFPNPANDELNLNYHMEGDKEVTLRVVNLFGQQVHRQVAGNQGTILDIRSLQNGYYILSLEVDGEVSTHKFVKR